MKILMVVRMIWIQNRKQVKMTSQLKMTIKKEDYADKASNWLRKND